MTRRMIYGIGLWVYLAAVALTFASIALPDWVSYTSPTSTSPNPAHPSKPIHVSYGLHKRCSSLTGGCTDFPQPEDCHGEDRYFCSMWRTAAFLMNFCAGIELATFVAFAVALLGGREMRENGWKLVVGLLSVVTVCQVISMSMVAYLFDHDSRFFVGWKLDRSWILCTISWIVLMFDAIGISVAAYMYPSEDDYEPIPDRG